MSFQDTDASTLLAPVQPAEPIVYRVGDWYLDVCLDVCLDVVELFFNLLLLLQQFKFSQNLAHMINVPICKNYGTDF